MLDDLWPGLAAAAALALLLILIIRWHVHAFVALLLVSVGLGLAAGLPPGAVVDAVHRGLGDILRDVALLLALGAMLGRLLEASGAAELIAGRLIAVFGPARTSVAVLLAAFLIGIPILFNVGFLLLLPIVGRLQRQTGRSFLYFLLPMTFGLSLTHSLVPPHPGVVGAVQVIAGTTRPDASAAERAAADERTKRVMVETILYGTALSLPLALLGWAGPGRWWAARQMVLAPGEPPATNPEPAAGSFPLAVAIVVAPLVLSAVGFGTDLAEKLGYLPAWMTRPAFERDALPRALAVLGHAPLEWFRFAGKPTVALAVPTALAFWVYGMRRGWSQDRLAKLTADALGDVGGMLFLFGAAGGFKEVIVATGVGRYLAEAMLALPLSPVASAFAVAALVRAALGSATASILTASALLAGLAARLPGQETLLVLAVACGVTIMTQPADSGFWMVKEYGNLSVRDVMLRFNGCRVVMALAGLGVLLGVEAWFG